MRFIGAPLVNHAVSDSDSVPVGPTDSANEEEMTRRREGCQMHSQRKLGPLYVRYAQYGWWLFREFCSFHIFCASKSKSTSSATFSHSSSVCFFWVNCDIYQHKVWKLLCNVATSSISATFSMCCAHYCDAWGDKTESCDREHLEMRWGNMKYCLQSRLSLKSLCIINYMRMLH